MEILIIKVTVIQQICIKAKNGGGSCYLNQFWHTRAASQQNGSNGHRLKQQWHSKAESEQNSSGSYYLNQLWHRRATLE